MHAKFSLRAPYQDLMIYGVEGSAMNKTNSITCCEFMDSCFALIGAHQHGIAVGSMNKDPILTPLHNINRKNVKANKFILGPLGGKQP